QIEKTLLGEVRPAEERQFDQDGTSAGERRRLAAIEAVSQVWTQQDLVALGNLHAGGCPDRRHLCPGRRDTRAVVLGERPVQVRGGNQDVESRRPRSLDHRPRDVERLGAVVDARQEVKVEVDHEGEVRSGCGESGSVSETYIELYGEMSRCGRAASRLGTVRKIGPTKALTGQGKGGTIPCCG